MSARNGYLVAVAVGLLCAGCATKQPTPEITRAQTWIEEAEKSGARQYAADQLDSARSNLRLANAAQRDGKQEPDPAPVVKLFNPLGAATWLATELDEDGDVLFGLADLGFGCASVS